MAGAPDYRAIAVAAARRYGIDPSIFLRQINQESGFNSNAKSGAGAEGIAQFMPGTAAGFGIDPYNPRQALMAAAKMDAGNLAKYGSYARMLSAYNSGRADAYKDPNFAGGQTYNYVRSILNGKTPTGVGPVAYPPTSDGTGGLGPIRQESLGSLNQLIALSLLGGNDSGGDLMQMALLRKALSSAASTPTKLGTSTKAALSAPPPASVGSYKGGDISFLGDTQGVKPQFLNALDAAAASQGATQIKVISGYRSPAHNAAIGGAPHSLHTQGAAMDGQAFVPGKGWVPLGQLLAPVAGKFGLRSGDQPGFFNGAPDPNHVDFMPSL